MKAEVKYFSLVGGEFTNFWPDDPEHFCLGADATIGPVGVDGGDNFSFQVCTPSWFAENKSQSPVFVRHWILMNEYDEKGLFELIRNLVDSIEKDSWDEISLVLSRYMFSEFEDYEDEP